MTTKTTAAAKTSKTARAAKKAPAPQKGKADLKAVEQPKPKRARKGAAPKAPVITEADAAATAKQAYKILQLGAFPADARKALADRFSVPTQDAKGKSRYVRELNRDIAKAIGATGVLPEEVLAHQPKPKAKKETGPRRIATIVRVLRSKQGGTIDDIAAALLADFPTYSDRHGGGAAELDVYKSFARTAISHLRAHRQFSEAKAMAEAGETVVRGEDGRYRIVKAK